MSFRSEMNELQAGSNEVVVRITTVLGNYAKSLGGSNSTADNWTKLQPWYPSRLAGPVVRY